MKTAPALALVLVAVGNAVGRTAPVETPPASLADVFKPGVVLQDRNGDSAIDFVDVRIVLAEQPSSGELAAASDIAARLGYETSAMNLPVPVARGRQASGSTPMIFVGAKSLIGSGVTLNAIGGARLKAGDGAVVAFSQGGKTAVAVLGGDDSGLASAALMLAGHLPYVWDQKGPTTDRIADEVKQFLVGKGVTPSSAAASAIYTRSGAGAPVFEATQQTQNRGGICFLSLRRKMAQDFFNSTQLFRFVVDDKIAFVPEPLDVLAKNTNAE